MIFLAIYLCIGFFFMLFNIGENVGIYHPLQVVAYGIFNLLLWPIVSILMMAGK